MADKSPKKPSSKKPGKSLKEKRAEKREKSGTQGHAEIIPSSKKH